VSWTDDELRALRERDRAKGLISVPGWEALAAWVLEQAQIDRDAIERGAGSWDEYQRRVGRLEAFRKVLARPDELIEAGDRLEFGGIDDE
jgi:hypothetical protein